jgi:hypothetical protein
MQLKIPPPEALELIRFDSERQLFDELSTDKLIASIAQRLGENNTEDARRRGLLANALRITDRIIPTLMEHVELAKRIAHLEGRDVETFIYNDPKQAASCVTLEKRVFLLISSGLYSNLTERELLFVIGHEFGHVVYNHYRIPTRVILSQKGACDAETALKLMAWSRRAEISADRVGLLCCQEFDAAAKAFIKLSSGLNEELADFDLMGYVSQVTDLEAVSRSVRAIDDLYSTHPFNPIRIVALYRAWQSDTFCRSLGHAPLSVGPAPGRQSDQDADARIHELLQYMDPDRATMGSRNVDECLVWGGLWVAASGGQIDQSFVQAISKAVNSPAASEAMAAIQKHAEPFKIIRERFDRAAVGCRRLPPPERHAIVQQMIAMAKANVDVAQEQRNALQGICVALGLNPGFADRILAQYAQQVRTVDSVFAQMF